MMLILLRVVKQLNLNLGIVKSVPFEHWDSVSTVVAAMEDKGRKNSGWLEHICYILEPSVRSIG